MTLVTLANLHDELGHRSVVNLLEIRGDKFHTPKNRPLLRMRFRHDSFSKKTGQEEGKRIRWNQVAPFGLWRSYSRRVGPAQRIDLGKEKSRIGAV